MAPPNGRTASTPAVKRDMRRKSIVGVKQPRKTGPTLVGLRQNNRELAQRLEETEESLQRSLTRNIDLQAECTKLNEQLATYRKEVQCVSELLDTERRKCLRYTQCMTDIRNGIDSTLNGSAQPTPAARRIRTRGAASHSAVSRRSSMLRDRTNVPTAKKRAAKRKARPVREAQIAVRPTTADIEEEDQQFCTPSLYDSSGRTTADTDSISCVSAVNSPAVYSDTQCCSPHLREAPDNISPAGVATSQVASELPNGLVTECSSWRGEPSVIIDDGRFDFSPGLNVSVGGSKPSPLSLTTTTPTTSSCIKEESPVCEQPFAELDSSGVDRTIAHASSSALSAPSSDTDTEKQKLKKRRRSDISYALPSLHSKLRSGDPYTEQCPHWEGPQASSAKSKKTQSRTRRHSMYNSFPAVISLEDQPELK